MPPFSKNSAALFSPGTQKWTKRAILHTLLCLLMHPFDVSLIALF